jgi:NADH-quinone oxidoreductase subunit L
LHDAPPAMAIVLVLLAIGSVVAGYVGVPNVIMSGGNRIEAFLEPSFEAPGGLAEPVAAAAEHPPEEHNAGTEMSLMLVSTLAAFAGIGVATYFFRSKPQAADAVAAQFGGLHRLLLGKYYVDELYDATIVQPIKRMSTMALWRGVDAGVIDGTVNAVGLVVRGWSAVLRRAQTGSIRAYAMWFFAGVVLIVGYYVWR